MQKVTPFLTFGGTAEEAVQFYVSLLPDSRIDKIVRTPIEGIGGPDSVLLIEFTLAGMNYIALNTGGYEFTEAVSFAIACESQEETDRLWAALTADGGKEIACGWLKDRWGLFWQITPTRLMELIKDPDQAKAARAMRAMMDMVKIDIAGIEQAVGEG